MFLLRFPLSGELNVRGGGFWEGKSLGHRSMLRKSIGTMFVVVFNLSERQIDLFGKATVMVFVSRINASRARSSKL